MACLYARRPHGEFVAVSWQTSLRGTLTSAAPGWFVPKTRAVETDEVRAPSLETWKDTDWLSDLGSSRHVDRRRTAGEQFHGQGLRGGMGADPNDEHRRGLALPERSEQGGGRNTHRAGDDAVHRNAGSGSGGAIESVNDDLAAEFALRGQLAEHGNVPIPTDHDSATGVKLAVQAALALKTRK